MKSKWKNTFRRHGPQRTGSDTGNSSTRHKTNPSLIICHSVCNELGGVELWEWDSWKWRDGGFWEGLRLEAGEGWGRDRGEQGRREDIPARQRWLRGQSKWPQSWGERKWPVWKLSCQWRGMRSGGKLGFVNWAQDFQQLISTAQ